MARKEVDIGALQREYHKVAKKLDERLRVVERFSEYNKGYQDMKNYAYKNAQALYKDIYGVKVAKPRFDKKPPTDVRSLKTQIKRMKDLLERPTLYVRKHKVNGKDMPGYETMKKQNVESVKKWSGMDINWLEFDQLYEKARQSDLLNDIGSELLFKLVGFFQKNKARRDLIEDLNKILKSDEDDITKKKESAKTWLANKEVFDQLREDPRLFDAYRDLNKKGKLEAFFELV